MKLNIKNMKVTIKGKKILSGINLDILPGKIIALMGPNGSGKSTLAQVIMGHPAFEISPSEGSSKPSISFGSHELLGLSPDKRAKLGLFLAFQNPVSVPGVSVANLLRTAIKNDGEIKKNKKLHNPGLNVIAFNQSLFNQAQNMQIPPELLRRGLNEDFSGGEKKKLEMLQARVLEPKIAIFDEIDTGLDVDALKTVAGEITALKQKGSGILIITHYQRILKYARPDIVYILIQGVIMAQGDHHLAKMVEENGYKKFNETR